MPKSEREAYLLHEAVRPLVIDIRQVLQHFQRLVARGCRGPQLVAQQQLQAGQAGDAPRQARGVPLRLPPHPAWHSVLTNEVTAMPP